MSFPESEPIPIESLHSVARTLSFGEALSPAKSSASTAITSEPIKVVLRVRKFTDEERETSHTNCVTINKPNNLVTIIPRTLALQNATIRKTGKATFQFGQIFDPQHSQQYVFHHTAFQMIQSLFNGKDGLIFAYGTTNAGKTYTIQGTEKHPGLLPRSLDMIFNSIKRVKKKGDLLGKECNDGDGNDGNDGNDGSDDDGISEQVRTVLLDLDPDVDVDHKFVNHNKRMKDDTYVEISNEMDYSIIVSYLEIYNEQCFDLLDRPQHDVKKLETQKEIVCVTDMSNNNNNNNSNNNNNNNSNNNRTDENSYPSNVVIKTEEMKKDLVLSMDDELDTNQLKRKFYSHHKPRRKVLKIRERTATSEIFVENLKEIKVDSVHDVEVLLAYGQQNRRTEQTNANHQSSRSHTIFTITLEQRGKNGVKENVAMKSSLSIVDLAGSERTSRTNNNGERLRETAKINMSLMNLGRCLETLRRNQQITQDGNKNHGAGIKRKKLIPPFRQSRLTRLFQRRLENGSAIMLVNISPVLQDADETIHALQCATVAKEVYVGGGREVNTSFDEIRNRLDHFKVHRGKRKKGYPLSWKDDNEAEHKHLADDKEKLIERVLSLQKEVMHLQEELDDSEISRREVTREAEELREALAVSESRLKSQEIELRRELTEEFQQILKMKRVRRSSEYTFKSPEVDERLSSGTRMEKHLDTLSRTARKNLAGRRFVRKSLAKVAEGYKELYEMEREAREFEEYKFEQEIEQRDELLKQLQDRASDSAAVNS